MARRNKIMDAVMGYFSQPDDVLCLDPFLRSFSGRYDLPQLSRTFGKLVKQGKLTAVRHTCPLKEGTHVAYSLPLEITVPEARHSGPELERAVSLAPLTATPLAETSVDGLAEEIFLRCQEIMRRIRGGTWKFVSEK